MSFTCNRGNFWCIGNHGGGARSIWAYGKGAFLKSWLAQWNNCCDSLDDLDLWGCLSCAPFYPQGERVVGVGGGVGFWKYTFEELVARSDVVLVFVGSVYIGPSMNPAIVSTRFYLMFLLQSLAFVYYIDNCCVQGDLMFYILGI